ncbi:hypothetical protein C1645_876832 [Glomus cerebriforme]|uniref:Uncharacterized protein n=1 Tax=Glomus cerebriforme TaxID=658196 RepID=A0A397SSX6_9GLOM|nr:hypothetical protein C1645_876832 [Glomus cerebriforme]
MDKYKSFYGALLIIIILLNFVSVCATNEGSKKSKSSSGGTSTTKTNPTPTGGGNGGTPPATPPEGGGNGGAPPATPPGGGNGGIPSVAPPGGGNGGTPPTTPPGGGANAPGGSTALAYAIFSNTPSTTTVGRQQVNGLITLYQPPDGNTIVTGNIGAILDRVNGDYRFTIMDGGGAIYYDCTGRVNPLFIGQASLFSFTWDAIKLSGPNSAVGKYFNVQESGGTLVNGKIVMEYDLGSGA